MDRILNVTVLYLAEHKGHVANDEDKKAVHLLLVNLGFAWGELCKMQDEFRARFGGLYEPERIELLDAHERSNFRHLWAPAFVMRHERRHRAANICHMLETKIEQRKAQFLRNLATEIDSALKGDGVTIVKDAPWRLDGKPHLCVACNHASFEGFGTRLPNVVTAMWRAAQSGGWREFEWKPLEIEWPRIAIVNMVRGKALLPAYSTILTASLFTTSGTFEVKPFHYIAMPTSAETFASSGLSVWESPLLRTVITLQGHLLAFGITHSRFYNLAKLILDQNLKQADTDRILARFSSEVRIVLSVAQRSYTDAVQILLSSSSPNKVKWLAEVKRLCSLLLFELDEDAAVTLNLETFATWIGDFQTTNNQFQQLIVEIVRFAIDCR